MDVTALGTLAVGAIVGIWSTWPAMRRDSRETRIQAIAEAGKTIDLLKEQTELMRRQGETREREWQRLEQTRHDREARLEKRIEGVEGDYRRLVLTVTSMGLCANAPDCADHNPGDRRRRRIAQPSDLDMPRPRRASKADLHRRPHPGRAPAAGRDWLLRSAALRLLAAVVGRRHRWRRLQMAPATAARRPAQGLSGRAFYLQMVEGWDANPRNESPRSGVFKFALGLRRRPHPTFKYHQHPCKRDNASVDALHRP